MKNTTHVRVEGPEPYRDRDGDEHPEWYVFTADLESEPTGKVYTVRRSFGFAYWLGMRMSFDRQLPLAMEAQNA